ncbi:MAG TPA: tetratricopeptide repeat protein [Sandaracinaceae bacterium LLY-WYZ-13_1]|nr:tetratricopeptide repeat protein [Sandaracinaceae bacterium LLY-WYZ-13_1]
MARAQDREQTAAARALFEEGVALADEERWEDASDRFRRSLALRGSSVVAYNLGMALVHTGELVEASELFRRARRDAEAPGRLRDAAERELAEVQGRLGRLTIELTGPREGVELRLDGEPVRMAMVGVAVPANPGARVIVALRGGGEVARAEVSVSEGGAASVALEIPPAPEVPTPEEAARAAVAPDETGAEATGTDDDGGDDVAIWVGIITGIVAVGAAAAITTVVVLENRGPAEPIEGNLVPGTVEFGP